MNEPRRFTPEYFANQGATVSYTPDRWDEDGKKKTYRPPEFKIEIGGAAAWSRESWAEAAENLAWTIVGSYCGNARKPDA